MKGFKDTTKTVWTAGGYAKGGAVNGAAKVSKVMREFKSGELRSGSKTVSKRIDAGQSGDGRTRQDLRPVLEGLRGEERRIRGAQGKAEGGPIGKLAAKRSMHREQEARTDAIVARGNRVAAEEQPSEALVMRRRGPNTPLIQSSAPPRSLLERKACGGLAAMPRKQGR